MIFPLPIFPNSIWLKKLACTNHLPIYLLISSFFTTFQFFWAHGSSQLFCGLAFLSNVKSAAYNLFSSNVRNANITICRLVLIKPSQFFHKRRHFSNQAKLRSTTQRLGITANVCNSLRFATSTSAFKILLTSSAKGFPV